MKKTVENIAKKKLGNSYAYNFVAVIVQGGNIISIGTNNMLKSHPVHFRAHKNFDRGVHAEFDALRRVKHQELKSAKMYVIRFKKDGTLGNSKPCKECSEYISQTSIGKVYYIEDEIWKKL